MMFMRAILALSLAAFALAIPVASPHADGILGDGLDVGDLVGAVTSSIVAFLTSVLG
ncbi:hypothetical protein EDB85DRAFT_1989062, partial [Lactarius pseudohatsudake]